MGQPNSLNTAISIRIAGTKFDRRRKLSDIQRAEIIQMYNQPLHPSQRTIGLAYGVSQMAVRNVLYPGATNRKVTYKYTRKQKTAMSKAHRQYKLNLLLQGEI